MGTNVRLVVSDTKTAIANEAGVHRLGEECANYDFAKEKTQHHPHCDEAGVCAPISGTRATFEPTAIPRLAGSHGSGMDGIRIRDRRGWSSADPIHSGPFRATAFRLPPTAGQRPRRSPSWSKPSEPPGLRHPPAVPGPAHPASGAWGACR